MTLDHRHPRCVAPIGGAPTDATVIAELRREIEVLTVARNADRTEWMATYTAMRAVLDALRCGDLDAFHDGELTPERAAAFRLHLATCAACEAGLRDLMQLEALAASSVNKERAVVDAAWAWATADGPIGAIIDAVAELDR